MRHGNTNSPATALQVNTLLSLKTLFEVLMWAFLLSVIHTFLLIIPHFHFYRRYASITQKEFDTERYIGPFTQQELEGIISPFQSLPLSLVPKSGKPGKYIPVHNFLHPYSTSNDIASINLYINIDNFPCTWGTFHAVALLIFCLPPGSRASIRDVAEAYRTIPVLSSQWLGLVVRLQGEDRTKPTLSGLKKHLSKRK